MKTIRMIAMGLVALACITGFVACGDDDNDTPTPPSPSTPTSISVTPKITISSDLLDYATVQVVDSVTGTTYTVKKSDCKLVSESRYEYSLPTVTCSTSTVSKHSYRVFATANSDSLPTGVTSAEIYLTGNFAYTPETFNKSTSYAASQKIASRKSWKNDVNTFCSNYWLQYSISDNIFYASSSTVTPPTNLSSLTLHPGICLSKDVLTYSDVQIYDSLSGKTTNITLDKCKPVSSVNNERVQKQLNAYLTNTKEQYVYLFELPTENYTKFPVARHAYSMKFTLKQESLPEGVEVANLFIDAILDYEYEGVLGMDKYLGYNQGATNIKPTNWKAKFEKCTKNIYFWYSCDSKGLIGKFTQSY